MTVDLTTLLKRVDDDADAHLRTDVEIIDVDDFPSLEEMYADKPTWLRIDDVVAVAVDLKGSTRLNFRKHAKTSVRLYEAVTGNMVRITRAYEPDFIDVQGDGLFALYHGDRRYERALCAAITLKTFSEKSLVPAVSRHLSERFPDTGLKVGMAASALVVRRIGIRGTREPIWAGKAVNWATKAAQAADAHELVLTKKVFGKFEKNHYVRYSCDCAAPADLWLGVDVHGLPEDERTECMRLTSLWCDTCGPEFHDAILAGKMIRESVA